MTKPNPDGWTSVQLDEIADVRLGRQRSPKQANGEHMRPYMRAANVTWDGISLHDVKEMNFTPEEFERYALKKDDLLLGEASGSLYEVGKPAIWTCEVPGACFQNTLIRVRPDSRTASPQFLLRYFTWAARSGAFARASRGVGIHHLGRKAVAEWPTVLPPLNEQRRIVDKIDALFAHSKKAKTSLDRIPALLEKLKKSILAAAFRGDLTKDWREAHPDVEPADKLLERIRTERRGRWEVAELAKMRAKGKEPKNEKWKEKYVAGAKASEPRPSWLPATWAWVAWDEIGLSQNGRAFPSKDYQPAGVRLVRPGNLHVGGEVRWTDANTRFMPESYAELHPDYVVGGDALLMNLTAQSLKDEFLGRVCITSPTDRCLLNQRIAWLKPVVFGPRYFLWLLKAPLFRRFVDGLNTGSLIQHMFTGQLASFCLPLPPAEEAAELVRRVDAMMSKVAHLASQLEARSTTYDRLNQALLAKAFRGELVPQDPNDEPASVLLERIRAEREATAQTKPKATRRRARSSKPPELPPEPEPPEASSKPAAYNPQPDLPFNQDFLDLDPHEQAHAAAAALLGAGPLPKADALRQAADGLRTLGLSDHKRLRTGGKLHTALDKAITKGVRLGLFDRPARGHVRAIKPDASAYTPEDWRLCIDAVADEADDEDTLIRRAADWARAQLGLSYARLRKDGHIYTGLQSAYRRRKDTAT